MCATSHGRLCATSHAPTIGSWVPSHVQDVPSCCICPHLLDQGPRRILVHRVGHDVPHQPGAGHWAVGVWRNLQPGTPGAAAWRPAGDSAAIGAHGCWLLAAACRQECQLHPCQQVGRDATDTASGYSTRASSHRPGELPPGNLRRGAPTCNTLPHHSPPAQVTSVFCTIYYLLYQATSAILLLNLLIAMIIRTYNTAQKAAEAHWRRRWAT